MILVLNIFIMFCIFTIGALFGSFFSLAIYRLPRKEDIVSTRSYCPKCKHKLNFFDLIPILSYIFHFGKCKYCKDKISIRYFLLEISNATIFLIFYFVFGYTPILLLVILIYATVFTIIGALIMKSKMTSQELEDVKLKQIKKKELKRSDKKGVFVSEIIVSMVIFTIFLTTAYVMTSNYAGKSALTFARSNAVSLAVKSIEMALATDYDKLYSFGMKENIDGVDYVVDTSVFKYSDEDFTKRDVVKKIVVKVDYMVNSDPYVFELSTLKAKEK